MPPAQEPLDLPAPVPAASVGPRLYGVIDVVRPDRIAGWAIDRADSQAALEIDIHREGRLVATGRADRMRKDLERGNVGTGRYGFTFDLTPPLEPGFEFTVSATARAADGATCELRRAAAAASPADPERRLAERIFDAVSRLPVAAPAAPGVVEDLSEMLRRLEVAQARIEAMLDVMAPPAPPSLTGLKVILGVSLATGVGSLALGIASMLRP